MNEEIEEVTRIVTYEERGQRLLQVRFRSQVEAEKVLTGTWKLLRKEEYKNDRMRNYLSEEERAKMN